MSLLFQSIHRGGISYPKTAIAMSELLPRRRLSVQYLVNDAEPSTNRYMNEFALKPSEVMNDPVKWVEILNAATRHFLVLGDVASYWNRWTPEQQFCWIYVLFECTQWRMRAHLEPRGPSGIRDFILQQIDKQGIECLQLIRLVLGIQNTENNLRLMTNS